LFVESIDLAMDAVPRDVDIDEVRRYLEEREGVVEVHDLHVWAMSSNETALTAHLVAPDARDDDEILKEISRGLAERFDLRHTTVQVERSRRCEVCDLP
jgi:cobalt-zinc-cadmium efflux system protein